MSIRQTWGQRLRSVQSLLAILMTLGYLLGTHLSTINSLKAAIANKADRSEIVILDKKLTRIEVMLETVCRAKENGTHFNRSLPTAINPSTGTRQNSAAGEGNHGK